MVTNPYNRESVLSELRPTVKDKQGQIEEAGGTKAPHAEESVGEGKAQTQNYAVDTPEGILQHMRVARVDKLYADSPEGTYHCTLECVGADEYRDVMLAMKSQQMRDRDWISQGNIRVHETRAANPENNEYTIGFVVKQEGIDALQALGIQKEGLDRVNARSERDRGPTIKGKLASGMAEDIGSIIGALPKEPEAGSLRRDCVQMQRDLWEATRSSTSNVTAPQVKELTNNLLRNYSHIADVQSNAMQMTQAMKSEMQRGGR